MTLSKTFRFEAAHRLAKGYTGKCKNIHGHSWNGAISVSGVSLDQYDFLVDFGLIKIITKKVEDIFDHTLILCEEDRALIDFCSHQGFLVVTGKENPTSEALCVHIAKIATDVIHSLQEEGKIPMTVYLSEVSLDETCTSSCKYQPL